MRKVLMGKAPESAEHQGSIRIRTENLVMIEVRPKSESSGTGGVGRVSSPEPWPAGTWKLGLSWEPQAPVRMDLSEDGPPGGDGSEIPEENQEGHGMQSEDLGLYPEALRSH